mgnify:CR=1 FL=1|jgi:AmmeMemoRadiSam system protein A
MNKKDKAELLDLARTSIEYYLNFKKHYILDNPDNHTLLEERAVFVTLHKDGNLRGCIGQMHARMSLYKAVIEMAESAAFEDPRFPAVQEEELEKIEIEISVLSPMEKISDYKQIRMGIDGVWIKKDFQSGVYLPQVAIDTGWDCEIFLRSLCSSKAGLPADAYKNVDTEIYIFQVEKFKEIK